MDSMSGEHIPSPLPPMALSQHVSASPYTFTRDDLAALAAVHRREQNRFQIYATAGLIGALGLSVAVLVHRPRWGWSEGIDPFIFFGGWALGLGIAAHLYRRRIRRLAPLRLNCARCNAALFDERASSVAIASRADLIVSTARCPFCGEMLIDPHTGIDHDP